MNFIRSGVLIVLTAAEASSLTYSLAAPPTSDDFRPELTAKTRAEDLKVFQEKFLPTDKSYSPAARAEAEERVARLHDQLSTLSDAGFELELARIVALADNGHTHYVLSSISRYYNRIPVRLGTFGENFYVLRAVEADADLLGARLAAIDGHPIESVRAETRRLWGGPIPLRDHFAYNLLESPELLHAMGLAAGPAGATYRFETRSGALVERRLEGEPSRPSRPWSGAAQTMFPQRLPLEDSTWRTALSSDRAPWSLQAWPIPFRMRKLPEADALVIELRQNADGNGWKISDALKRFQAAIAADKPTNLIVDMRVNDGGDLKTTRAFMKSLPSLIPGRIFVLTSSFTFSAAISSVGYLKQSDPAKVSIVGENVGDRLIFFAEGHGVKLPNNLGMIGLATQRHDYATGCKPYRDCQSSVVREPIALSTLAPDIPAPWTIETYLAGRDPAIEAVVAALR